MNPNVAFRMMFGGLGAAAHFQKLRQPNGDEAGVVQKVESPCRIRTGENFDELIPDTFGGKIFGFRGETDQRLPGFGFDGETQLDGKTDCPQEAEPILGESGSRIADGTDSFGFEIDASLDEIEHLVLERIKKHPVDSEITPFGVFFCGGESDGSLSLMVVYC